jgi:hypothetical protein
MSPSGMLRRVTYVTTEDFEERIASIIRVTRIDELGTTSQKTAFLIYSCLYPSKIYGRCG